MESSTLFTSGFYQIKHWGYDFDDDKKINTGFNDCLCIVHVKKGNFYFNLSSQSLDMHSGHVVIEKPNYEYRLRPSTGECSIFNFTDDFYRQFLEDMNMKQSFFFSNKNLVSLMLLSNPELDYLQHQIMKRCFTAGKLEIDNLVLEFFNRVAGIITNISIEEELSTMISMQRLSTVEAAKEYMQENFISDISLLEIAAHCFISPFHFSRLFKKFTGYSPHQYLQNIRLKHGEMLLKNSSLTISEISYAAGFSSLEYFATAFKQRYNMRPGEYRK